MLKVQKALGHLNQINYQTIISKYPWTVTKDLNCILSPDIDGLLCGLFMSHYLGWKIKGFYDGKFLLLEPGLSTKDCIFLDMEILRKEIRSVGHHLNIHMLSNPPADYSEKMTNCINPNLLRGFDRSRSTLGRKYPLGTIHLLMYIIENHSPGTTNISPKGLAPVLFADGMWKILFKYTKNVLDWFDYLHSGIEADWWKKMKNLSVIDLIQQIDTFLTQLKSIDPTSYGHIDLSYFNEGTLLKTLELLSDLTGWGFESKNWDLKNLKKYPFTKVIYGQEGGSTSNAKFLEIWGSNPLSLAMTEGAVIQYTKEEPSRLP